jgi:hypothetical protein
LPLALLCGILLQDPSPYPRVRIGEETAAAWTFEDAGGWVAAHAARASVSDGVLVVEATGDDPYLHGPGFRAPGPLRVRIRVRAAGAGGGRLYWQREGDGAFAEERAADLSLVHDGIWRDVDVEVPESGVVARFRLDPGQSAGRVEIDEIRAFRLLLHPLEIVRQEAAAEGLRLAVRNHGPGARRVRAAGAERELAPGSEALFEAPFAGGGAFPRASILVESEGVPPLRRAVTRFDEQAAREGIVLRSGDAELSLDAEGRGAVLSLGRRPVAVVAPWVEGVDSWSREGTGFRAPGAAVAVEAHPAGFRVVIEADREVEGPALRVLGALEQGLFAGLEHLGRGERSSSRLDLETPEHVRFAPPRRHVTMPLMAVVTARGGASMTWSDMTLQPLFAAPNAFDGTADHRMALRGRRIETVLRVAEGRLEDFVLEAVRRRGLAPLPPEPRSAAAAEALALEALKGPLRTEGREGWGHCAEASWERAPFADLASAWWRLTGEAPTLSRLQPGGAHLRDDAAWFATGRVEEWLRMRRGQVRGLLREQKPDGSFRYAGEFVRGHFEDTASGHVAVRAWELLEFARLTGDAEALAAGLRALAFHRRFDTPRGAQTWEMPLHTPDLLAAGHSVAANVLGFELSGDAAWLDEARRWALAGLPFVYQWSDRPVMAWSTIAVLGATKWVSPNWIGLPVQWCGGVYAQSLAGLARRDRTLDWAHVARGILIAGEQMLAPDGPFKGCLPDSFVLDAQERRGPFINPASLLFLRRALDGKPHGLYAAGAGRRRVTAPFPVEFEDGRARIRAREGLGYWILIDGAIPRRIESRGVDEIPF